MTLNASGPISLAGTTAGQSIEIENGGNGTTQISLNDAAVRSLAGVPSGEITMPTNFYGKSNRVSLNVTLSANTSNYTFNKCKVSGYVAGKTCATLTINSGVYVYGAPGLTVPNTWTSGDVVRIVNNGFIVGNGGGGGGGAGYPSSGGSGSPGSTALSVSYPTSITNNNTVGGGGGGGGGGGAGYSIVPTCCGTFNSFGCGGSGGSGRGLSPASGGSGGTSTPWASGGSGGGGGCWGSSGSGGSPGSGTTSSTGGGGGGAAGPATSGNSIITWTVVGTRLGPLG